MACKQWLHNNYAIISPMRPKNVNNEREWQRYFECYLGRSARQGDEYTLTALANILSCNIIVYTGAHKHTQYRTTAKIGIEMCLLKDRHYTSICTSRNNEAGMDMGTAAVNAQMQADVQHESDTGKEEGSPASAQALANEIVHVETASQAGNYAVMQGMQPTMHSNAGARDAEGAPCTPEAADILGDAMARPEAAGSFLPSDGLFPGKGNKHS
jgi:hypothetical protein